MKLNKKGISPVIATVIIVAVAIAVAIAVAYWVTGIIPAFTRYEELKISSAYISLDTGDTNATVAAGYCTVVVRNTGSADASLADVLVNGRLPESDPGWTLKEGTILLPPGNQSTIEVWATNYPVGNFESGVVYDFTVHTAGGGSYPASARAP
jgi:flagellin-like protein